MNLTPEERQRIYEEEKARIEAQEEIKKEKEAQGKAKTVETDTGGVVFGCLGCLSLIVLIVMMALPKSSKNPLVPGPSTSKFIELYRTIIKGSNEGTEKIDEIFKNMRKGYQYNEIELYGFFQKCESIYPTAQPLMTAISPPDGEDYQRLKEATEVYLVSLSSFCKNLQSLLETGSLKSAYQGKTDWDNVLTGYGASNLLFTKITGENLMTLKVSEKKTHSRKRK